MSKKKMNYTSIGGQALIEGVMMKGPDKVGIAVRKSDGEIVTKVEKYTPVTKKHKILSLPIIRGVVNFFAMMKLGYSTMMYSAEVAGDEIMEQEEPSKFEKWISEKFKIDIMDVVMVVGVLLGVALALFLFMFLPTFLTGLLGKLLPLSDGMKTVIESFVKMAIFIGYMAGIAYVPDIKRVFSYHGAEHKTIFCYEQGGELTPESAKNYSRFHPRCGTNFMTITLLLSILVFMFVGWGNIFVRILLKLCCLPLIMGISYELIKLAGKYDNIVTRIISFPGMMIQRITTKEPDEEMLEVAITAFKLVAPEYQPGGEKYEGKVENE